MSTPGTALTKAQRTRTLLADTALRLFEENGFDRTTMRQIAQAAGVATGSAYYHFESKEALVQELYVRIQDEHLRAAEPQLSREKGLGENLAVALHRGVDVMSPYHALGTVLLRTALPADSPISPFSAGSAQPRDQAIALMRHVVETSKRSPGGRLGERLPQVLWLVYMGITLFWVLDRSAEQARTRVLIDGAAPLIGRLLTLARMFGGSGITRDALDLLDRLDRTGTGDADPSVASSATHTSTGPVDSTGAGERS